MHANLRTFLDLLTRENEIITVKAEVDPYLELAEIHRRVIAEGGPALLFSRVKGSRYPVVTNLFGTDRRIDLAFGPKPEAFVREMVQKRRDFDRPHVFRVTQLVEEDVAPDPMHVGLLGLQTVSASTHRLAQPGNKPGLLRHRL